MGDDERVPPPSPPATQRCKRLYLCIVRTRHFSYATKIHRRGAAFRSSPSGGKMRFESRACGRQNASRNAAASIPARPDMKLSRPQANDLLLVPRWLLRVLAAAGSLQLAVALIATLAGVLAWATLVESQCGVAAAAFGRLRHRLVHRHRRATGRQRAVRHADPLSLAAAANGIRRDPRGRSRVAGRLSGDPAGRRRGPVADLRGPRRTPGLQGFGPGRSGPRLSGLPAPISAEAGPRRRHGFALFEPGRFSRPRRPAEEARRKRVDHLERAGRFRRSPLGTDVSAVSSEFRRPLAARRARVRSVGSRRPQPRSALSLSAERELRSGPGAEIRRLPADCRRHSHCVLLAPRYFTSEGGH